MGKNVKFEELDGVKLARGAPTTEIAPEEGQISDEQMELLKGGVRLIVQVPWPMDPAVRVGLHALSRQDMLEAYAQARLDARLFMGDGDKDKPESLDPILVEKCFRDQVVQRSFCWLPKTRGAEPKPLYGSVEELRAKAAEKVVDDLWEMYCNHERWVTPIQRAELSANADLFQELADRLKKKADIGTLTALPQPVLVGLVMHLVSRLPET